jgi:hypothetical protein
VNVLEDDRVLAGHIAAARAAVPDVVTDEPLHLQRDVLDDVRHVRAATQTRDETASLTDAALMLDQARHGAHQRRRTLSHRRVLMRRRTSCGHGLARPVVTARVA